MKKVFLFLFVACLTWMNCFGDEIILQEKLGQGNIGDGGGKSPSGLVVASLEADSLTLFFTPSASSQVIITDSLTGVVVYSAAFGVASTQVISLSSLPAGEYELSIYAYGEWWEGVFVIEE